MGPCAIRGRTWGLALLLLCALPAAIASASDYDGDGVQDLVDNCVLVANTYQGDVDGDQRGDNCECGDASGDGRVDALDLERIPRCVIGQQFCSSLCDASGDGKCNTTDARLIQRVLAGQLQPSDLRCAAWPGPQLDVAPLAIDFGDVEVGTEASLGILARNKGSAALAIQSISAPAPFAAAPPGAFSLPALSPLRTLVVGFAPTVAGNFSGTLTLSSDAGPPVQVALTGHAVAPAQAGEIRAQSSLDFGLVDAGTRIALPLTIHNAGGGALTVSALSSPNAAFEVRLDGPDAPPFVVPAGASRAPWIELDAPLAAAGQTLRTTLQISSDDPTQATSLVDVSAHVTPAAASPAPTPILDARVSADTITAASCAAVDGTLQFGPGVAASDSFIVTLVDESGAMASSGVLAAVNGPGSASFSGIPACDLLDGHVGLRVDASIGGFAVSSMGHSARKNTSALAPPVVQGVFPQIQFARSLTLCGSARSNTTVRVRNEQGGQTRQTLSGGNTQFCMEVPLRPNVENVLHVSASDDLQPDLRDVASAAPLSVVQIDLEANPDVQLEARLLDAAEIAALRESGVVDLEDPENTWLSLFSVSFDLGSEPTTISFPAPIPIPPGPDPIAIPIPFPPSLPLVGAQAPWAEPGTSQAPRAGGCTQGCKQFFAIALPRPALDRTLPLPATPSFDPIATQIIPGVIQLDERVRTLRELFDASIRVFNGSSDYTLDDLTARASVPAGLTPIRAGAGTNVSQVDPDGAVDLVEIGDVGPGQTGAASFTLRADAIGVHPLEIGLQGFVTAPALPQAIPFGTSSRELLVEVAAPPQLGVALRHPSDALGPDVEANEIYPLIVEIENLGSRTLRSASVDLSLGGASQLVDENGAPLADALRNAGEIQPGHTASLAYRVRSDVQGEVIACSGVAGANVTLSVATGPAASECLLANTAPADFAALPADPPPVVLSVTPPNGADDVSESAVVSALLTPAASCIQADQWSNALTEPIGGGEDEIVDADLASIGSFYLEQLDADGQAVAHVPTALTLVGGADTTRAELRPGLDAPSGQVFLAPDTRYRATLVGGAAGVCSNATGADLENDFVWSFRTGLACEALDAPQLTLLTPPNAATERPIDQVVMLRFDNHTDVATLRFQPGDLAGSSFGVFVNASISGGDVVSGTPVAVTASLDDSGRLLTLKPNASLPPGATVHVRVTDALEDLCGNALDVPGGVALFSFQVAASDGAAPAAPSVNPLPVLTNQPTVLVSGTAEAGSQIVVTGGASAASSQAGTTGLFSVSVPLKLNQSNALQVRAEDASGNASPTVTVDALGNLLVVMNDSVRPVVLLTDPANGATGVPRDGSVTVGFSEPMQATTLDAFSFALSPPIAGSIAAQASGLVFTPSVLLPYSTTLTARVRAGGARDLAGNALDADLVFSFTTVPPSPDEDTDLDGLTNAQEAALGTDPFDPDSDDDSYLDGEEVGEGSNPLDAQSRPDGVGVVSSITPGALPRGVSVFAAILGTGLDAITSLSIDGTGITLVDLGTGDATRRNVRFDIAADAPFGAHTVDVNTATGTGRGTVVVGAAAFTPTIRWVAAGGGAWSTAANWSPARVPLPTDDVLIATSAPVTLSGNRTVRRLSLYSELTVSGTLSVLGGAASPALQIAPSGNLREVSAADVTLSGGVLLDGLLTMAAPGTAAANLRLSGTQSIDGNGTLLFNANINPVRNLVSPTDGGVVTIGPGITIACANGGNGRIGAPSGTLVFHGTLKPDPVLTTARIDIVGPIELNGGSFTVLPGPGQLNIDDNGAIRNGTIAGTGTLQSHSHDLGIGVALHNLTLEATIRLIGVADVFVTGGMTLNGGTIRLANPTFSDATLWLSGTQTLGGTGRIIFEAPNGSAENEVLPIDGGIVTIGSGITITAENGGNGRIGGSGGTLRFLGTLTPDPVSATSRVEIGGLLDAAGGSFSVASGAGSVVLEDNGAIRNTRIHGSGILEANSHTVGATLENVTLDTTLRLGVQSDVTVTQGMTLNGSVVLATTNSSDATLRFSGTQSVGGTGRIVYAANNAPFENEVVPMNGGTVTIGAGITVTAENGGDGVFGSLGGVLDFHGTFVPDPVSTTSRIEIGGVIDSAGGAFSVVTGAGVIALEDNGVIRNARIAGNGTLDANGHNLGVGAVLDATTLDANLLLGSQSTVVVTNGLTLNGKLSVATPNASDATLRLSGTQFIGGAGAIVFSASNNAFENEVQVDGGSVVTLGPNLRVRSEIAGDGQLSGPGSYVLQGTVRAESAGSLIQLTAASFENQGRLEVGAGAQLSITTSPTGGGVLAVGAGGQLVFPAGLTLNPASTLVIDAAGTAPTSFGRVTVTGAAALDGRLQLVLLNGFVPVLGDRFQVLTYGSHTGAFDELLAPPIGGGRAFALDVSPTTLAVVVVPK